jgi:hypothetical protein
VRGRRARASRENSVRGLPAGRTTERLTTPDSRRAKSHHAACRFFIHPMHVFIQAKGPPPPPRNPCDSNGAHAPAVYHNLRGREGGQVTSEMAAGGASAASARSFFASSIIRAWLSDPVVGISRDEVMRQIAQIAQILPRLRRRLEATRITSVLWAAQHWTSFVPAIQDHG